MVDRMKISADDCMCPEPCAACGAKLPKARTLAQIEADQSKMFFDFEMFFDFVVTDGTHFRMAYAKSESVALEMCRKDNRFARGVGIWCAGLIPPPTTEEDGWANIDFKKDVFNPRAVFPPFMNPYMMDIYGYC